MKHDMDVIVIGGGHAGCEAASASARLGARTLLVTLRMSDLGTMSCNPAIGGLGKGHLVREVDALDGIMARVADNAGIQFRLLNRRKGPAVQGPRAQADRRLYRKAMSAQLCATDNLSILAAEVTGFHRMDHRIAGIRLSDGSKITARSVILTSGTFLRGVIHIGNQQYSGGRIGDRPAIPLAYEVDGLGLTMGRLKTGTPPRLDGKTIHWDQLETQPGDDTPVMFSFLSKAPVARQVPCHITFTNPQTHDIIRENLKRSAIYGGQIESSGPRYCPSVEDKIVRFADKSAHQIFLEPESLSDHVIYPNGISTSLPANVQKDMVRSIAGLEDVEIVQPGYAIEYDYVDPRCLDGSLAAPDHPGLFLAGQINGTTGYEEAAAQGLVAGLNAALASRGEAPVRFSRSTSYIGVMIDDLTTRGVTEPYRMFTSRAEYRLSLRADNADTRLTPFGIDIGLVGPQRARIFKTKYDHLARGRSLLQETKLSAEQMHAVGLVRPRDGRSRSAWEILSYKDVSYEDLFGDAPDLRDLPEDILSQLKTDALYASYVARQKADIALLQKDEGHAIPRDFDYASVSGLSSELRLKLTKTRPETLAQASRIEGMTPAALTILLLKIRQAPHSRVG